MPDEAAAAAAAVMLASVEGAAASLGVHFLKFNRDFERNVRGAVDFWGRLHSHKV
jgi:hypothetical protein